LAEFGNDVMNMQRSIRQDNMKEESWRFVAERNLPSRIIIETDNDPTQPHPNCKHAEIDLRDYETSRVLRFGQCIHGGIIRKIFLDGQTLMTEREFEIWMNRTEATYEQEN
jgi:hypothetical protein